MLHTCIDGPLDGQEVDEKSLFLIDTASDKGSYRLTDGVYVWHPQTAQQRRKVALSLWLAGIYGVALILWPFAALGAVMLAGGADVVQRGTIETWFTYYLVFSIILYPAYWAIGFSMGLRSAQCDEAIWWVVLKSSIPLLSGMSFFAIRMLADLARGLLFGIPI